MAPHSKQTRGMLAEPHNSGSASPGGAAETRPTGTARNGLDQAVAGKLLGLLVASLKDGKGDCWEHMNCPVS